MVNLFLNNTLDSKKEKFSPINEPFVKMYVCGITPYDEPHVGHGRVYVTFDILYRLLKFLGFKVTYCRNFTDIDDKLLNKAALELKDKFKYTEIADRYINSFHEDMNALNCLKPDCEPRVTKVIPEIINFIDALIKKGMAYELNGSVYFEVRKFKDYGKLSKRKLEDLKVGARIEIDETKKDPLDFALWKNEPEGTFWKSPWGYGRPGWHIECSVMAEKFLDKHIDIHAGGMDLIFPHHENEIAQSEGLYGGIFAKYWLHNAFVRIDKQKMSKSLGNFFTLKEVFKKFDPMILRYYYINHNYSNPLDFSYEELKKIQKTYQKICKIFDKIPSKEFSKEQIENSNIAKKMLEFLCDNLNTAGMIGIIFENLYVIENNPEEASKVKFILQEIVGLELIPLAEKKIEITPEIEKLIQEREIARKNKDWQKSDEIREKLKQLGYEVKDKSI